MSADEKHQQTWIIADELYKQHDTGDRHPECPERFDAVTKALKEAEFNDSLRWTLPRKAENDDLVRAHDKDYVLAAQREISSGRAMLSTGDTSICKDSLSPTLHAAGSGLTAIDAVMKGDAKNAFCVMRPPGHHATPDKGMGFCVYNNIAVAARYAQAKYDLKKVLIVDWDVHHGNGTQDIFYADETVFFFSTHQSPWYPGTGDKSETGTGAGLGSVMNRPFPAHSDRDKIVTAFKQDLQDAASRLKPELVLISAGFDSRLGDPLGQFRLSDADFADLTDVMLDVAKDHCKGRLVSMLEGGYHLDGLAKAAAAHCGRLVERVE